jgi:Lon protease-like protein
MKKFPDIIPVFPLSGVIYFPKTNLPLNIFEQRYLDLVNDAYQKDKLMGMVQSRKENNSVYKIGCLGKISDYQKSKDGRILINLTGVTRFQILDEVQNKKLYREFKVDYKRFVEDIDNLETNVDTKMLMDKAQSFFKRNGLLLNWKEFEKLDFTQQINTLGNDRAYN